VVLGYNYQVLSFVQLTVPERGVVRATWPIWEFYTPWIIFETAKATDFKFYARFGHEMYEHADDQLSPKWVCSGPRDAL